MQPATDAQFRSELARLIEFGMAFGIPYGDPVKAQKIYHQVLAHLPADVLHVALDRVMSEWTWGNRLPMPAEILENVSGELSKRTFLLGKCEMALKRLPMPVGDGPKRDVGKVVYKALSIAGRMTEEQKETIRKGKILNEAQRIMQPNEYTAFVQAWATDDPRGDDIANKIWSGLNENTH